MVTDPSGAIVVGAKVTVTDRASRFTFDLWVSTRSKLTDHVQE